MTKLPRFFSRKISLEERIKRIQLGDKADKNKLIEEYIPFIKKNVSAQLGKYVEVENNDAFSIGLMAFNEAIDQFDANRGSFLSFATVVIRSRIIDQQRKEGKVNREIYISQLAGNEENENPIDNIVAVDSFEVGIETKMDMAQLVDQMKIFQVTLDDLVKEAPKHIDTRHMAIEIGKYVHKQGHLKEKLMRTKNLPVGEIMEGMGVSKKVIQRSRKFIIAVILILDSNLDTLKRYIIKGRGDLLGE